MSSDAQSALASATQRVKPLCVGRDEFTSESLGDILDAMEICAECPVWRLCREAGKSESAGVWGGLPRGIEHQGLRGTAALHGILRAVEMARVQLAARAA